MGLGISLRLLGLLTTAIPLRAVAHLPPPPGGIVERQIEQEYDAKKVDPQKEIPLLEVDIPEKKFEVEGDSVYIEEIVFQGNTVISSKKLQKIVAPYLKRELTMGEIHRICDSIQIYYAKKGYFLARAYPPVQDIQNGKLEIRIIEGVLGDVSVIGNKHYSNSFITKHFHKLKGKPINQEQILKALLLIDENSDIGVGAVFKKGKAFGTADLIVRVKDNRPLHLTFDHNNYGSLNTSKQRTGMKLNWGNALTYGDMFTLIEVVGSPVKSLDFTNAVYHIPINPYGSSFDLAYLFARFKTDKNADGVKYTGISQIGTLKYNQALQRTKRLNTTVFTSFDYKQVQNIGNGKEASYDKLRVLSGGGTIDYVDRWKGRNLLDLFFAVGIPNFLGGSKADSDDSSRLGSGGQFFHLNGTYKRLQELPWECLMLVNGVGQYSMFKLPLPEQIYIGGMDTVRGYKLAEGLGDSGFYANFELHVPPLFLTHHLVPWSKKQTWGDFLQFVGFVDHGQTFNIDQLMIEEVLLNSQNKREVEPVQQDGRVILTSVGAGVRMHGPWKLECSFDAAYPLTHKYRSSNTILYFRVALNIL